MSQCSAVFQSLPNIQDRLESAFNAPRMGMVRDPLPFLEFLLSPENNFGLSQKILYKNAKQATVELVYDQRIAESDVNDDQAIQCTASTRRGDCAETYTIDPAENRHVEQIIRKEDLRDSSRDAAEVFATKLMLMIDVLERDISTKAATESVALAGSWSTDTGASYTVDGANNLELDLYDASSQYFPQRLHDLRDALVKSGYGDQVAVFGGNDLITYLNTAQQGCCTNVGLNLSEMWNEFGVVGAYDRRLQTALGGSEFSLALQPGSLAAIAFTENNWLEGADGIVQEGSNYAEAVIISPRTGMPMDLYVKNDCGNIQINLYARLYVRGLPSTLFPTGDNFDGVTFVNRVEAT